MSTDVRGHTSIAAGETPSRAALAAMLLSVKDPIPVASTTARATLITTLGALTPAIVASTSNPIYVFRADATPGKELEYTVNGSTWLAIAGSTGIGANVQATSATTETGTLGAALICSGSTLTLPAGTWQIVAGASVQNTTATDTAAVGVYNFTTSVAFALSVGAAGITGVTTGIAGLVSRPLVVALTTSTQFRVVVFPNGSSTLRVAAAAAGPASYLDAVRLL